MSENKSNQILQRIRELADQHLADITNLRSELESKEQELRQCFAQEREMTKKQTTYCSIT